MKLNANFEKGFASDNCSGVSPEVMDVLSKVNQGHHPSYGENDSLMEQVQAKFQELFGSEAKVFFVFTGTGANVLTLQQLTKPWQAIVTAETSHINVDETGAPEKFIGSKLLTIRTENGKIYPEQIIPFFSSFGFQHHSQPHVISISQPTELGTIYTCEEIKNLTDFAHQNNMLLYIDGARIANAAASMGKTLKEMTTDLGVDAISFGGTKNGLMFGEAVVFLKKELAKGFEYNRKQGMQLASKMRFIAAQFLVYLENNLWLRNANNANMMAQYLENKLKKIPQVKLTRKVEANGVFVCLPETIISKLQEKYFFHIWDEKINEVRLMCSFDTNKEDIDGFVDCLKRLF